MTADINESLLKQLTLETAEERLVKQLQEKELSREVVFHSLEADQERSGVGIIGLQQQHACDIISLQQSTTPTTPSPGKAFSIDTGYGDDNMSDEMSPQAISSVSPAARISTSRGTRESLCSDDGDEMFIFPLNLHDVCIAGETPQPLSRRHSLDTIDEVGTAAGARPSASALSPPFASRLRNGRSFNRPIVDRWRAVVKRVQSLEDPWTRFHLHDYVSERATRYRYSAATQRWVTDTVWVKMQPEPFAHGAMRECFRLKKRATTATGDPWEHAHNYVSKRYMSQVDRETYFEDVRLQMDAKLWSEEYNRHNPPKKVDIAQVSILEFIDRDDAPLYHLEHFIEGQYIKYNSNSGFVSEEERNTPQAFSHFTFERSGHQLIVVDVQGVGDLYTDPQIHTADGKGYGDGNLGTRGMALFFHSHACNDICKSMVLSRFDLSPTERAWRRRRTSHRAGRVEHKGQTPAAAAATVCRKADSVSHCTTLASERTGSDAIMDYIRNRSLSSHSSEDNYSAAAFHPSATLPTVLDMDETDESSAVSSAASSEVRSPSRRRRLVSSAGSEEEEREAFWNKMRGNARPSCYMEPADLAKLREAHKNEEEHMRHVLEEAAHFVIGQVHLDLARYHELGRFVETKEEQKPPGIAEEKAKSSSAPDGGIAEKTGPIQYDRAAAWFHLELAVKCSNVEAMTTMANILFGMPHDLLVDFQMEQDEDNVLRGLELTEAVAATGDRPAMRLVAEAYDSGQVMGVPVEKDWQSAAVWYQRAVDESQEADAAAVPMDDSALETPRHATLARLAEMHRSGGHGLGRDAQRAGDLYNEAAEAAMEAMKGKMANKYYMSAEECFGEVEEDGEE